jgi:hypothetical protein
MVGMQGFICTTHIISDGNSFFRCLAALIAGGQKHYREMRRTLATWLQLCDERTLRQGVAVGNDFELTRRTLYANASREEREPEVRLIAAAAACWRYSITVITLENDEPTGEVTFPVEDTHGHLLLADTEDMYQIICREDYE